MKTELTNISGILLFEFDVYLDQRGCFIDIFEISKLRSIGIKDDFIQDAITISNKKNTIRGLHFQYPPFAQSKIVRCERGAILDIAVDLRKSSPTYGQHCVIELSEASLKALYLPVGIAHGVCTLEDDTRLAYKISGRYSKEYASGIAWNDPNLEIDWPVSGEQFYINDRDENLPFFDRNASYFP